jgi:spore coat polysaccharide biosynthesis predicted glycosyltransferase SpsG
MCAGGVTSYEFASLGVPFAIICQYKHQRVTAKEWQNKKVAWNLGFPNKKTKMRIHKFVKYAIEGSEKNTSKGKSVVDGFGAKRVAKEILDLIR